jgi:DNA-binding NarL/FixJ family response regulator
VTKQKKILIIDDHPLFADGLSLILQSMGPDITVSVRSNAQRVLEDKPDLLSQNLVLIDLYMPSFDGFAFLTAVKTQKINVPIAVISGAEDKSDIERAIGLGAQGFIPKDSKSSDMLHAVEQLLSGRRFLPYHWLGEIDWLPVTQPSGNVVNSEQLTARQRQVLALICDGMQNKQIATVLGISVSSVKGHVELLFKNLNVNNRTACVKAARERGLID